MTLPGFLKSKSFWTHTAAVVGGVLTAVATGASPVQAVLTALKGLLLGN